MVFPDKDENSLHHLLAYYSNETLTHGAWLASFIIGTAAFVILKMTSTAPEIRMFGGGSLIILFVLFFAITYTLGRLFYFSQLVSEVTNRPIIEHERDPLVTSCLYQMHKCVVRQLTDYRRKFGWYESFWFAFAYEFRESFKPRPLLVSAAIGSVLAVFLFLIGNAVLFPFN